MPLLFYYLCKHKTRNNAHILYNGDCQYMKNTMATNIV